MEQSNLKHRYDFFDKSGHSWSVFFSERFSWDKAIGDRKDYEDFYVVYAGMFEHLFPWERTA